MLGRGDLLRRTLVNLVHRRQGLRQALFALARGAFLGGVLAPRAGARHRLERP